MELPCRPEGDILLKPGELTDIRRRLKRLAAAQDIASVIICAFDHRTRMLPFVIADTHAVPAGPRAIGSALVESGLTKTRIVLQQWKPHIRPSRLRLDGRMPDLLLVSSMSLHTASCRDLLRDAQRIDPAARPLVIAGGSVCIFEPWEIFSADPSDPYRPDVAVTGEEYVLLQLLERLLELRAGAEPLRQTFLRARDAGHLNDIPGLIYPLGPENAPAEQLVDTGIQRLCGDLDEQAHPVHGYTLLDPPGRGRELADRPIPPQRLLRHSPLGVLVMTLGCKYRCAYCPIPAYNQRQFRVKSGARVADEISQLHRAYGLHFFFGSDDNFFNDITRTLEIIETLAGTQVNGRPLRRSARIGTEVTVHDTLRMREHLPLVRVAGFRAFWMGVEDMSGSLVKKGQTVDATLEAFRLLRKNGILANPMMMHHDDQPLLTTGRPEGLLNQVHLLQQAGACTFQVLMITPSAGSKLFDPTFASGMVYDSAGGKRVEPHMYDGNYVVASVAPRAWRKQLNLLAAYVMFYNPLRLLAVLLEWRNPYLLPKAAAQVWGMWGLLYNIRRTAGWALRLMFGRIVRRRKPPTSSIPMRSPDGAPASHSFGRCATADRKERT